ncbi:MAG: Gfo/Idh/MocA family protein [Acidimicrobiales bacterium]
MTLRVGFLGAGLIANYHAWSLSQGGEGSVITAVHDPDEARAVGFAQRFGAAVLAGADEVIAASDAVYVCTWTSLHRPLVEQAVAAGRAVFCEKPLGVTAAEAEAMTALAESAGVVNQVGLVLRSVPGFALLRSLLSDPQAGRLSTVIFRDDQELPVGNVYGSTWRADRHKAGAGTLLEHSIHDLDLLEWLCGPLDRVSAYQDHLHRLEGIEDTVSVSFRFCGGGTGVLSSTWHDIPDRPSSRRFELFTERARFEAEGNAAERVSWGYRGDEQHHAEGYGAQQDALTARGVAPSRNADVAFVEAVRAQRPASPDFRAALRAHHLVDAVYRSARSGGAAVDVSSGTGLTG